MKKIYVIGSLKNPEVPVFANKLRGLGFDVFDDWHYVGPDADDYWRTEEKARGRTYPEALAGASAQNTFNFDKRHLDACDIGVMLMPAGKSGHLEFGYLRGQGKPAFILFDKEPERWDVMVNFATAVFFDYSELAVALRPIVMPSDKEDFRPSCVCSKGWCPHKHSCDEIARRCILSNT